MTIRPSASSPERSKRRTPRPATAGWWRSCRHSRRSPGTKTPSLPRRSWPPWSRRSAPTDGPRAAAAAALPCWSPSSPPRWWQGPAWRSPGSCRLRRSAPSLASSASSGSTSTCPGFRTIAPRLPRRGTRPGLPQAPGIAVRRRRGSRVDRSPACRRRRRAIGGAKVALHLRRRPRTRARRRRPRTVADNEVTAPEKGRVAARVEWAVEGVMVDDRPIGLGPVSNGP
jgi:hypothetical protein